MTRLIERRKNLKGHSITEYIAVTSAVVLVMAAISPGIGCHAWGLIARMVNQVP